MQLQSTGNSYSVGAKTTERSLRKTSSDLKKILERLATAQRINRASDDAAGLGVSEVMRSNIRGFKMASQNINDAMSALDIADGTANEVNGILQRQRELAVQSKNDTLTNSNRQALDKEYQQLNKELDRLAEASQFNRQNLTNGTGLGSGTAQIQVGSNAGDQITLPSVDFTTIATGLNGTSIATASSAGSALSYLDTALKSIGSQRSVMGSTINRLESTVNNLTVAAINIQAAESVIRDEDMADGVVELTRTQLLLEGNIAAFSRFNEISQSHIMGLLG
ncbi:MAG TPA: flagellin [Chitinispirillaceae bacterium]|nr:flagellin [Chitinispirillaceae bacterium]